MYYKTMHILLFSFSVLLICALIFGRMYYKDTHNFADVVNLIAKRMCLPASDRSKLGNYYSCTTISLHGKW